MPKIILPTDLRPYHLKQAFAYVMDNKYNEPDISIDPDQIEYTMNQLKTDIESEDAYDDVSLIRTHTCTRCNEEGVYSLHLDTGIPEDEGKMIHCITCDGWGKTMSPIIPERVTTWPQDRPVHAEEGGGDEEGGDGRG